MEQTTPTVRDVLDVPEVQRGHPVVLAGAGGLHREVTWVHVLELSTIAGLLRGGEMVLLTGVALPDTNDGLRGWVEDLLAMGASAAMIQLGERWAKLPTALVRAADRAELPLIGLHTVVPFVDITRAVLTSIVHCSYAEMLGSTRVHELFHRLALDGCHDGEVVAAVSGLTGTCVVLEDRHHHVLAFQAPASRDTEALLREWERRSRRDGAGEGWVIEQVRAHGQPWGRLIAPLGQGVAPTRLQRLAVERGAENIALRRVLEGDGAAFALQARSELLTQLTNGHYRYEAEGRARAEAAGFPMSGRTLLGVAVRACGTSPEELRPVVARSAAAGRLELLMGPDNTGLLSLPADREPADALGAWAERLRRELASAVIGTGGRVEGLRTIRGSLLDAAGAATAEVAGGSGRGVVGLADVRVRGLLAQLGHDPRLQGFVERELAGLLDHDRAAELTALRAYLAAGRNKSAAAHAAQVSRPAFYARLRRAATLLDADLDDAQTCLSLQLALLAHDMAAAGRVPDGGPGRPPASRP